MASDGETCARRPVVPSQSDAKTDALRPAVPSQRMMVPGQSDAKTDARRVMVPGATRVAAPAPGQLAPLDVPPPLYIVQVGDGETWTVGRRDHAGDAGHRHWNICHPELGLDRVMSGHHAKIYGVPGQYQLWVTDTSSTGTFIQAPMGFKLLLTPLQRWKVLFIRVGQFTLFKIEQEGGRWQITWVNPQEVKLSHALQEGEDLSICRNSPFPTNDTVIKRNHCTLKWSTRGNIELTSWARTGTFYWVGNADGSQSTTTVTSGTTLMMGDSLVGVDKAEQPE